MALRRGAIPKREGLNYMTQPPGPPPPRPTPPRQFLETAFVVLPSCRLALVLLVKFLQNEKLKMKNMKMKGFLGVWIMVSPRKKSKEIARFL
jgi:hypothetical protein